MAGDVAGAAGVCLAARKPAGELRSRRRWDGQKVPTEAGADGVVVRASLDAIERGVHDLDVSAPPGTVVKSVELEVAPGTPP
jgi:hypothetical protein